jgi:uncharacterized membrane protein
MNRDWYKPAIWLMWVALPTTALNYWRAWDQLPVRMAVHFDASWQPNGWTSREGALMLALGIGAFLLVVFTIAAYIVRAQKPSSSWAMLILFYISLSLFWLASNWIVTRNLNGATPHSVVVRSGFPHA